MTVETETVNSVAQPTLGPDGGTLRVKASSETIRPGKSRRRAARKAPSLNSNTVSTRADIFEDRVKNAMDAASSDDSDETFVYESNPPEPQPQPRRSRHHSRTPSGASLASMAEQQRAAGPPTALRSIGTTLEAPRAMPKSRSMKFANAYSSGADEESIDRGGDGTIRASAQRGTAHHHHLGRPARGGHPSILDDDGGPFLQPKTRSLTGMSRANGRGTSNGNGFRGNANGLGRKDVGYQSYDLDADGGDDERTPLMNTIRGPRGRRNLVRVNRHGDYQTLPSYLPPRRNGDTRGRSCMSRFAGCVVLFVMLMLLTFGAVGFLFAISTPLAEVEIVGIENVLASEQELMVDLVVRAVNPNLLPITVADMDINIFAKSKFVGSEKWWRDHGKLPPLEEGAALATVATRRMKEHKDRVRATQAPQQPTVNASGLFWPDPDPDPSGGDPDDDDPSPNRQTMLLGRIARFDSPLTFEGSFLRRRVARSSTGSLRLSKPGNRTEAGGTERWERVLRHSFELIVRGTLRYRIPLGGRAHAVPVARSVIVHPESEEVDEPVDGEIKISKKEVVRDMGKRVKMMFWG
ncbi:hypothetical protein EJ06DRAFT_536860 [Trichodelitschia bisporula]|uniref:Phospholipid metabolism enzyme regulator n=1 Tax=Trichodelitschia bisporula TaxID=703511 RepID=A0A6G1I2I9_9PEZI|nr:hypothetical protein EJ06DRAFT_536860 [Trichodelitschia bisporula]